MSIRLSEAEAWDFIASAHTGIVTTLRRDGFPVSLPIWFVAHDRRIYIGTPATSKKVARIRNDDRASFLVESGDAWVELAAVHLQCRAQILDAAEHEEEMAVVGRLLAEKYAAFRPPSAKMPSATSKHYRSQAWIRLDSEGDPVSWDNGRIRMRTAD